VAGGESLLEPPASEPDACDAAFSEACSEGSGSDSEGSGELGPAWSSIAGRGMPGTHVPSHTGTQRCGMPGTKLPEKTGTSHLRPACSKVMRFASCQLLKTEPLSTGSASELGAVYAFRLGVGGDNSGGELEEGLP